MRRSSGLVVHRKARGKPGAEGRLRVSQAAGLAEDGAKLLVGVGKRTDVRSHVRQLRGERRQQRDALAVGAFRFGKLAVGLKEPAEFEQAKGREESVFRRGRELGREFVPGRRRFAERLPGVVLPPGDMQYRTEIVV